ncbi:class II glutamine amidotransferase [Nocardia sp. NBC_00881]|uniref:class II glutamine amidotransferase n=1 Tax=Nocardia sp. NBC_00881 TaxID=2975995 RepID=UPI003863E99F|nr:class II glutamine amidotransferase [Nocardia sp. NBC_00881]
MCLLTYCPPGATPDPIALSFGASANPHGHGFAILTGDRIHVGRGMRAATVIDQFMQVRARYPDGAALFHSRFATHGVCALGNCHPFRVGGDPRTVLAHNGTLPKRVHPGPYDPRSDTRIAAEDYLPDQPFGSIDTHRGARGLASWLGSSKLVILTVDPTYQHHAYLFGEQAGRWDGGVWYSNTSSLPPSLRWPTRRRYVCGYCQRFDFDRTGRYCTRCGWCFDCETAFPDCTCLIPKLSPSNPPRRRSRALMPPTRHRSCRQAKSG